MPEETAERPNFTSDNKNKVVWNQCKMLRDSNRRSADAADLVMQAIEAAPELDLAMQAAFGIRTAAQPVRTPIQA